MYLYSRGSEPAFCPCSCSTVLTGKRITLIIAQLQIPPPSFIAAALADGVRKTSKSRASPPASQARLFRIVSIEIVMGFFLFVCFF